MLKVDKRKLTCFGHFDGDFLTCIECYDSECRKATNERIEKEDGIEKEDEGDTNADNK